jgi:hypothetical protein
LHVVTVLTDAGIVARLLEDSLVMDSGFSIVDDLWTSMTATASGAESNERKLAQQSWAWI